VGDSIGLLVPGPHEFGNEYHLRLYTIAGGEKTSGNKTRLTLCIKRCFYIDDYSGEKYEGKASNYFCDRAPGDKLTMAGPFKGAFTIPDDESTNLLMVGLGTGIAPFRAFVRHIYDVRGGWKGKVRLFFGAKTGLEMLYMNDKRDDFANYYDEDTFKAFEAVSPGPPSTRLSPSTRPSSRMARKCGKWSATPIPMSSSPDTKRWASFWIRPWPRSPDPRKNGSGGRPS